MEDEDEIIELANDEEVGKFLDQIGIPFASSGNKLSHSISYNVNERKAVILDEKGKVVKEQKQIKEYVEKKNPNSCFFSPGTLLTAKSGYNRVIMADFNGDLPFKKTEERKSLAPFISIDAGQQITVIEEGELSLQQIVEFENLNNRKEFLEALIDPAKHAQKNSTKRFELRYIKGLTYGKNGIWFDLNEQQINKPLIVFIILKRDVSRKFLTSLIFDIKYEEKSISTNVFKNIDCSKTLRLCEAGFIFQEDK